MSACSLDNDKLCATSTSFSCAPTLGAFYAAKLFVCAQIVAF